MHCQASCLVTVLLVRSFTVLFQPQARTRVLHGQADPLVPVAAAADLQAKIPGAVLDLVPGMGHDLPLALLPRIAKAIADTAHGPAPAAGA